MSTVVRRIHDSPSVWALYAACGTLAVFAVPAAALLGKKEAVALGLIVAAFLVIGYLPRYRVPFLFLFCYLFPRTLEEGLGWGIPLMSRTMEGLATFEIGIVPLDGALLLTAVAVLGPKLLCGKRIETGGRWWGAFFAGMYLISILFGWFTYPEPHDAELAALVSLARAYLMWVTLLNSLVASSRRTRLIYVWSLYLIVVTLGASSLVIFARSSGKTLVEQYVMRAGAFGLGTGPTGAIGLIGAMLGIGLAVYHPDRRARIIGWVGFIVSFMCISLTFSRGPLLVCVLFATWVFWRDHHRALLVWIGSIAVGIWFLLAMPAVNSRLELVQNGAIMEEGYRMAQYRVSLRMIADHPLFGMGAFRYYEAAYRYLPGNYTKRLLHSHNLYLHIAAETGIIGFIAFAGLFGTLLARARRTVKVTDELRPWRIGAFYAAVGTLAIHLTDYILWEYRYLFCFLAVLAVTQIGSVYSNQHMEHS